MNDQLKMSRQRILYVVLTVLLVCGILACIFFPQLRSLFSGRQQEAQKNLFAMDTYITMTAYGTEPEAALEEAARRLTEAEKLWSVTDPGSDIYALNHSHGQGVTVSEDTKDILSFVLEMAEETGGALEPTIYPVLTAWGFTTEENRVPNASEITSLLAYVGYDRVRLEGNTVTLEPGMMLDLGAVGKGYAGDLAAEILRERDITSALLDIGGNIQTIGSRPDGNPWRLGLRDPFSDGILGVLEISNMAVVTSGSYERYFVAEDGTRYGHIIDPETGYPVDNGLAAVTIVVDEGRVGDALSTALFVMGLEGAAEYWRQHQDFDMILITDEGAIYITEGIADAFSLNEEHGDMALHVL